MKRTRHLSIEEKRDWLATVFRDENGEFTAAEKFKALTEDTKLAGLQREAEEASEGERFTLESLNRDLPPEYEEQEQPPE